MSALPVAIVGAVLLALVVGLVALRRYLRTEAFRHSDLRRASFELLVVIGPFFGVHVKPSEPEPSAVLTPKGDDDDPLAAQLSYGDAKPNTPGDADDGVEL